MPSPDTDQLRTLTQAGAATWSSGDFHVIARTLMSAAEDLVRAADPAPDTRLLDIACGSGNVALIAARRFCDVTGIDIAANLIERARLRATAEGTPIDFQTGDAQALTFADGSFDVVTSAFGIMFAPDQPKAAAEALRVCRSGGRIALSNWMPEGFGLDFFSAHARHAPPPEGAPSPLAWGTEDAIAALLGDDAASIEFHRRSTTIYYRSIDHLLQTNARYFGPTIRALEGANDADAAALMDDLAAVVRRFNRARDGTVAMQADYLMVLATRA